MSMTGEPTLRSRIRTIAELATSDGMISWPFAAWVVGLSTIITSIPAALTDGSTLAQRFFSGLVSIVTMFALLYLLWFVLLRHLSGPTRVVVTAVTYIGVGASRGFLLFGLLVASGANYPVWELTYRVLANTSQIPVILCIGTYVVEVSRRQRRNLEILQVRQAEAAAMVAQLNRDVQTNEEQILVEIRQQVDDYAALHPITTAAQVQDFSRNVIRPLSHQLSKQIPHINTVTFDISQFRLPLWSYWKQSLFPKYLQPGLSVLATFCAWFGTGLVLFGTDFLTRSAPVFLALWYLALHGIRWFISKLTRVPTIISFLITIALVSLSAALCLLASVRPGSAELRLETSIAAIAQATEYVVLIAIAAAIYFQDQDLNQKLEAAQRRLDWSTSRAQLVQWHNNGRVARVLHGPIRAELMASWVSLYEAGPGTSDSADLAPAKSMSDPAPTSSIYDSIQERISTLVEQQDEVDVTSAIYGLARLWHDKCTVEFIQDPGTKAALNADPAAADLTISILEDAIANSIHHGEASKIKINLSLPSPDLLRIVVIDNGIKRYDPVDDNDSEEGFGTAQLRACAVEWQRILATDTATLTAVLPVEQTEAKSITPSA